MNYKKNIFQVSYLYIYVCIYMCVCVYIKYQLLFKRKGADIQRPHKPNCTTVPSISLLSAFWGLSESKRKKTVRSQ